MSEQTENSAGINPVEMGLLLAGTAVGLGGVAFFCYALYLPRAPR